MLAANGIGTPRLLLLSSSPRFPDGLANASGLVGRRLMLHPAAAVLGVLPEDDLESWLGPSGQPVGSLQFYESDVAREFPRRRRSGPRHPGPRAAAPARAAAARTGRGAR